MTPSMNVPLEFYVTSSLQDLNTMHRFSSEKHPSTFDESVLTGTSHVKNSSLLAKKKNLNTMSLFSFDASDKTGVQTTPAETRAQCVLRTVTKLFG